MSPDSGSLYALDHLAAARELTRTVRPEGRIVVASWAPGSVLPAMGAVVAEYLPPSPMASGAPSDWGQPEVLRALLEDAGAALRTTSLDHVTSSFADPREAAAFLIRTAGHLLSHQTELVRTGRWESLHADLADFATRRGDESGGRLVLHLEYLIAVAHPTP